MGKPRQRNTVTIDRNINRYIVIKNDLPSVVLWRDILLTILAWGLFAIAFYRAFLFIGGSWLNRLPNITDQKPVNIQEFVEDISIYILIIIIVIAYVSVRLIYNYFQWHSSSHRMVSLPVVSVEEQAITFHASPYQVMEARKNKICSVSIDAETGFVAEIEIN